jgi:Tol biopolymer transport system component
LSAPDGSSNALLQDLQVSRITASGNAWRLALSPDCRYIVYVRREGEEHRLDGSAPYQLTRFREDDHLIEDFEWSADGKRLAVSRSRTSWDIVLFRGLTRREER